MNVSVRLEQALGAGNSAARASTRAATTRAAISASATSICASAPTTTDIDHRHAARAQHARRSARSCSASCGSSSRSRETTHVVVVERADGPRARRVHVRRRRAVAACAKAGSSPSRRTSTSRSPSTRCASASQVDGGWWDSTQQSNANGTFTFSSLDDYQAGRPRTYTRRVGDPQRQLLAVRGRLVHPGRLPPEQEPQRQPRPAPGSADARRRQVEPGAARGVHLGAAARATCAAATASSTTGSSRTSTSRPCASTARIRSTRSIINPSYPGRRRRRGHVAAAEPHSARSAADAADDSSGVDRLRAAAQGEWGKFRTDYMLTRATDTLRSINVNAPLNGVRPDPTAGNITQIESTGRRAFDRITVGDERCACPAAGSWATSCISGRTTATSPTRR